MSSHVISTRFLSSCVLSLLFLLTACGTTTTSSPSPTPTVTLDAYGTPIVFPTHPPQRIVSLVPSMSEILGALNLQNRVVGVDYNTNYPASLASLPKVSDVNGRYNVEQIVSLKPDLVLSYGAETKEYDVQLASLGLHIVDVPAVDFTQTLEQINLVGRLTFTQDVATKLVNQLQQQINQIKAAVANTTTPKVLLEVDDSTAGKPYVFGGGSFGDELLQDAHAINIFHNDTSNQGYPQVTDEAIISANPQYVILTEIPQYGGDVNAVYKRPNWGGIDALKTHHVYRVNADIIQRPDQRLVDGLRCLAQIIHPHSFSGPLPAYCSGTV
jgi:iron complex transport system substrate-binding protein